MTFRGQFLLIAIGVALASGCAETGSSRPTTYPVTGTVTLNCEAVDGATVTFVAGKGGTSAVGSTDASGQYSLTSFGTEEGALPGEYGVQITQYEGDTPGDGGDESMDSDAYAAAQARGGDDTGAKNLLPEKYASMSTSGFSASVSEGENSFDFPMEGGN